MLTNTKLRNHFISLIIEALISMKVEGQNVMAQYPLCLPRDRHGGDGTDREIDKD
jgi:hypothetical protein